MPKKLDWIDFAKKHPESKYETILFPVEIGVSQKIVSQTSITSRGTPLTSKSLFTQFDKKRLPTPRLDAIWDDILNSVSPSETAQIEPLLEQYHDFFDGQDGGHFTPPPGPLDFNEIKRPVLVIVYLDVANWVFSGHKQFECVNNGKANPLVRQISTFDNRRGILFYRGEDDTPKSSDPFKYDFYVTVYQEDGTATDIIIDPRDFPRPP